MRGSEIGHSPISCEQVPAGFGGEHPCFGLDRLGEPAEPGPDEPSPFWPRAELAAELE